ncbi:MAG: chorismate mutase [Rhodothermales bacterium]
MTKPPEKLIEAVRNLLAQFESDLAVIPERPTENDMTPWRERIDVLDRAMLQIMNERVKCATAIGAIKKKLGMPVYVPSREEEVLRNAMADNAGPLSDAAVRRLFERVIDETRSLERHKYQEEE